MEGEEFNSIYFVNTEDYRFVLNYLGLQVTYYNVKKASLVGFEDYVNYIKTKKLKYDNL
jgi:hypothetical protein